MSSKRRVAPTHQIISDFRESNQRISIAGSWHLERALLQILVASHAHSGSRAFHGKRYVDTTENDIVQALGYDLQTERRMRQNWINAVQRYADAALEGNAPPFAVDIDTGLPLFGIGLFRWLRVNPAEVLTGLLLGGMRDLPEYRKRAQDRYDITIGYGRTHPVCLDRMAAVGLDAGRLAHEDNEDRIAEFIKEGIIVPDTSPVGGEVQTLYVRYRVGPGASDDCAILAVGKLFGLGAAVGCFLADAVDTLEKFVTEHNDWDAVIADRIRQHPYAPVIEDDDIVYITFLASTPPGMERRLPDSTLRHFLERNRAVDLCLLESHFLYLMGHPWEKLDTGNDPMMTNEELYAFIEERMTQYPHSGKNAG